MSQTVDYKGRVIKPVISNVAIFKPFAFEEVVIDDTAGGISLTSSTYSDASYAKISIETAPIRFRVDGGTPTTELGHPLSAGDLLDLESPNEILNFKAIRTEDTSATLIVTYFR